MKIASLLLGNTPVSAAQTALANLTTRRETLEARLVDANARLNAARSARKAALEGDAGADLSPLTRSVREVEDEVETLHGVLSDVREQAESQMIRLDRARDDELRAETSRQLGNIAAAVDTAGAELDSAMKALGKAANKMVAALPVTLQVAEFGDRLPESQNAQQRLVAAVIAEGLASVFPSAFPIRHWSTGSGHTAVMTRYFDLSGGRVTDGTRTDDLTALTAKEATSALITGRLRHRAAEIVAGNLAPELNDVAPPSPPKVVKSYPLVEVYALQDFAYRTAPTQSPHLVGARWAHNVPEDAANAAVNAGLALRTDSAQGARAFADRKAERARSHNEVVTGALRLSDCVDLGLIRQPDPDAQAV